MTKARDSRTAPGAFARSIHLLGEDPEHGDSGMDRAVRATRKRKTRLYEYQDPEGFGPPIGIAELIDDLSRRDGGGELNFEAWSERRKAAGGPAVELDPLKLFERAVKSIQDATKAVMHATRDPRDGARRIELAAQLHDALAAFWRTIADQRERERGREDRRDPSQKPKLVGER
jgi:hypothetical protein